MAEKLFSVNPNKFVEVYNKTNGYDEFIQYLKDLPNFKVINMISELDRIKLYNLTVDYVKEHKG